ncbi:uncharacterized protein LOC120896895 isoform X2 [Anopheles arabiensis]|uniref:uncharacterized protein LOC120896895 isoform X2 n=1 Tax=Anopheles arabiensis TaxID=7173 RepID=UPI001AADEE71|nr:uncharacterized protein LOC120896895 isoform X2 [Anopheles arabiensis]
MNVPIVGWVDVHSFSHTPPSSQCVRNCVTIPVEYLCPRMYMEKSPISCRCSITPASDNRTTLHATVIIPTQALRVFSKALARKYTHTKDTDVDTIEYMEKIHLH